MRHRSRWRDLPLLRRLSSCHRLLGRCIALRASWVGRHPAVLTLAMAMEAGMIGEPLTAVGALKFTVLLAGSH